MSAVISKPIKIFIKYYSYYLIQIPNNIDAMDFEFTVAKLLDKAIHKVTDEKSEKSDIRLIVPVTTKSITDNDIKNLQNGDILWAVPRLSRLAMAYSDEYKAENVEYIKKLNDAKINSERIIASSKALFLRKFNDGQTLNSDIEKLSVGGGKVKSKKTKKMTGGKKTSKKVSKKTFKKTSKKVYKKTSKKVY